MTEDERLMAYADGQLDPAAAASVEAVLAIDATAAAKVARYRASRGAVAQAFAPIADEPPPARLIAAARGQTGASRFFTSPWVRAGAGGAALAASFILGVLIAPQLSPPREAAFLADAQGLTAGAILARALSTQASGEARDGVRIAMTAPSLDGGHCRAFAADLAAASVEGVACTQGDVWRVVALTQHEASSAKDGYATASGRVSAATLEALDARRAGDPLGADEERAAIARGFKTK